jgi:hypothetical protein
MANDVDWSNDRGSSAQHGKMCTEAEGGHFEYLKIQ